MVLLRRVRRSEKWMREVLICSDVDILGFLNARTKFDGYL